MLLIFIETCVAEYPRISGKRLQKWLQSDGYTSLFPRFQPHGGTIDRRKERVQPMAINRIVVYTPDGETTTFRDIVWSKILPSGVLTFTYKMNEKEISISTTLPYAVTEGDDSKKLNITPAALETAASKRKR
jgi:hypothetical protein